MKIFQLTICRLILVSVAAFVSATATNAQTTTFTYQGRLSDGAQAANGTYDLGFALFDAETGGTQIGAAITRPNVGVSGGIFTVQLDFGANPFASGANRFLQIAVKKTTETNFTTLTPRQPVTSTPYAIQSLNAANASSLGGTAASGFVQTNDSRLSDARTPTAGSANYIQNTTTQQALSNFNVGGTGAANIFNAATQFNIGGSRVLSIAGNNNLFAGRNAGAANTTGEQNTFVGESAGFSNTTGRENAFFGFNTGYSNTGGSYNAFFGRNVGNANTRGNNNAFFGFNAGFSNTTGFNNSFVGSFAGFANTTGEQNSFVGVNAGNATTTGLNNSFVGTGAGFRNTTGNDNSFVGESAGFNNTTGESNSFVGGSAGFLNTTGSNITVIGQNANVGANNLTYATAIGSGAVVSTSNTVVLGRASDTVIAPNRLQVNTLGAAGSTSLCRNSANQISTCTAGNFADPNRAAADAATAKQLSDQKAQIEAKQNQLDALREQVKQQQSVIDGLKRIVCAGNPNADVCRQP